MIRFTVTGIIVSIVIVNAVMSAYAIKAFIKSRDESKNKPSQYKRRQKNVK